MLNKITIMGRLVRDPELRKTQSDYSYVRFAIACERDFKDKQSDKRPVDFIDIVAWRGTADFVNQYFTKGRMAVVEGRLQTRIWQDDAGNNHKAYEILAESVYFGDSKPQNDNAGLPAPVSGYEDIPDDDGDLPF